MVAGLAVLGVLLVNICIRLKPTKASKAMPPIVVTILPRRFSVRYSVQGLDIFRAKVLQCNLRGQNNQGEEHGQQN